MPPELPQGLDAQAVDTIIAAALAEDIGPGDLTSRCAVPEGTHFTGTMTARETMVVAGLPVAARVFATLDPSIAFAAQVGEGARVAPGTVLARLDGPGRALLAAERTALNLLQHMSGIATITQTYRDAIAGTGAVLLDTRKTMPGLRVLAKYATRTGGAQNHRMGLYDGILIKDNHVALAGGVAQAVTLCRQNRTTNPQGAAIEIEVECDTLEQVRDAVAAGADRVLLDNMPPAMLRQALAIVDKRIKTEASGGITLASIGAVAETGVDFISVGALTHSVKAMDIGLDWGVES